MSCASARTCCFRSRSDPYLRNFALPTLKQPPPQKDFVGTLTGSDTDKLEALRKSYIGQLTGLGYKGISESEVFTNFPIEASKNKQLLGCYVSNMPFCKFLEKGSTPAELLLKMGQTSACEEMRTLSSILRENLQLIDLTMVFTVDRTKVNDFLALDYIVFKDERIDVDHPMWLTLVQSAFTELILLVSIEHAVWHLMVAHMVYMTNSQLCCTEILKIFNMSSKNVFIKAAEVKFLLFGSPLIFNQTLSNNEHFKQYVDEKISNFIENFNIDTVFDTYFNTAASDPTLNWLPGMKSNIQIIKKFVRSIVKKQGYSLSNENAALTKFLGTQYADNAFITTVPSVKTMLEMLLVLGAAFHSTTFEFTKLLFCDVFSNPKMSSLGLSVAIATIVGEINTVFGDPSLYNGTLYAVEVATLNKDIDENRTKMAKSLKGSVFSNDVYSTRDVMLTRFATNTYTTYI
jgi:hypothetical protein